MAERSVAISIVVKVEGSKQITAEFEVEGAGCDEAIQRELKRLGREVVSDALVVLDDRLSQEVPKDWENVGKEEREVITAWVQYGYDDGCTGTATDSGISRWTKCWG